MWDELEDTLKINEKNFEEIILNKEIRRLIKKKAQENIFKYYSLQGPKGRISGKEELENEIIIKILKNKDSFLGKTVLDLKRLIPNLISNICKDELSYIKVRENYSERELEILHPNSQETEYQKVLRERDETKLLLDTLGDECKELLLMCYLDKIPKKKIADDLKVHRNTISKKIFDCLQKLGEIKNGL
jgi:RNA polymerase sigma factor (sigma-70 family)